MLVPLKYYNYSSMMGAKGMDARTLFYLYGYGEINKEDNAMVNIADLAITSLETITAFTASGGNYLFTLDELQNATISQSQESTDITGKAGRKLSTLKRNKTFTISASNGLVSTGLLAVQTGGETDGGMEYVRWTEDLTVSASHTAETTYTAYNDTEGAEICALFIKNSDGTLGTELKQDAESASSGKFTYNDETRIITFHEDIVKGTNIFVIYDRAVDAKKLIVDDDIADVKAEIFVDAIAEDKCAKQYHVQLHVPKADVSAEFSIDMGDNQAIHSFEAQALAGKCGASGNFWEWTVFGATEGDYGSD